MSLGRRTFVVAALAAGLDARASTPQAHPLVLARRGDMPLILTVPHDGEQPIPGAAPRTRGTTVRDLGAAPLAEKTAAALEHAFGRRPYLVVARFSRKFADANRDVDEAFESPAAQDVYRAYHAHVAAFVEEVKARFPHGLLVDLHGQGAAPDTIFRGTRGGRTASALLARHGADALQGPHSLIGALAAKGRVVHPPVGSASLREDPRYEGGFTVARYGSHRTDGIDAIQLEFGRAGRTDPAMPAELAGALASFLSHHGYLAA